MINEVPFMLDFMQIHQAETERGGNCLNRMATNPLFRKWGTFLAILVKTLHGRLNCIVQSPLALCYTLNCPQSHYQMQLNPQKCHILFWDTGPLN